MSAELILIKDRETVQYNKKTEHSGILVFYARYEANGWGPATTTISLKIDSTEVAHKTITSKEGGPYTIFYTSKVNEGQWITIEGSGDDYCRQSFSEAWLAVCF